MDFLGLVEDLQEVRVWYECGAGSGGRAWRPSFPSSHFTATVLSSQFTATEAQLKRSVLSCRHWGEMSQMEGLCVCFVKKLKIQKEKLNKQMTPPRARKCDRGRKNCNWQESDSKVTTVTRNWASEATR